MSNNNLARARFEEGMADFLSPNYGRSNDVDFILGVEDGRN